jgi:endonuclease/exonuclease/phosphatase family metal-dependent hydrolase
MPTFPKPKFAFSYDLPKEIGNLRAWKAKREVPDRRPDRLLVATWNIANFGAQERSPSDLALIAEIVGWFDLVAIQEVRENFAHLESMVHLLPCHRMLFSDSSGNQERMTFVYDTTKLTLLEKIGEVALPPSQYRNITLKGIAATFQGFDRTPYLATFAAGGTSFLFVNAHLFYGSEQRGDVQRRALETFAIAKWADLRRRSPFAFTREIIVLGDFNMPRREQGDAIYEALTKLGLELPEHSTVVASSISSDAEYDQVAYFPKETRPLLTGKRGVFDFDGAIFPKLWQSRGKTDFKAYLRYYISDHRPLWMELALGSPR